jgi:hypothetical protein
MAGATLFYIDTNSWVDTTDEIYDPMIFKRLASKFPDALIIPEHENTRYYGFTAPYDEVRLGDYSAPAEARDAYPDAFGVISTLGGDIDAHRTELVEAVRRGDILLFRGWFEDPMNEKVKSIYEEANTPVA